MTCQCRGQCQVSADMHTHGQHKSIKVEDWPQHTAQHTGTCLLLLSTAVFFQHIHTYSIMILSIITLFLSVRLLSLDLNIADVRQAL